MGFICVQGALTHGDRRATESRDLSRFNIDNKYGRAALDSVMKSVLNLNVDQPLVAPPASYKGNFLQGQLNMQCCHHQKYVYECVSSLYLLERKKICCSSLKIVHCPLLFWMLKKSWGAYCGMYLFPVCYCRREAVSRRCGSDQHRWTHGYHSSWKGCVIAVSVAVNNMLIT